MVKADITIAHQQDLVWRNILVKKITRLLLLKFLKAGLFKQTRSFVVGLAIKMNQLGSLFLRKLLIATFYY